MNELNLIKEGGAIVPVYDYALNFDKNYQDAVNLGLNLFTGCRTISFWVKPDYTTFNGMTREFLLGQYGSTGNERTIYIEFRDTGVLRVVFETGASGGTSYLLESNAGQFFNGGQWYFVTFTIEAAGSTKIYIDGVLQSNTINHTTQLSRTGGVACLGRIGLVYPAINGNSTIKELNIWNVERSLAQVNADMSRVWTGSESGLKAYFPTNEGSGNTIQDINSIYTGTIITTNTTPNYIDDFIWVREQTGTTGGGNEKLKIDLFENQFVSVTKQSFNVNNLTQRLSGVTNNFKLPFTANNSDVFDYLDLNGNVSNKPYQINYVEYIQDGTPIIKKGRLNVKEVSNAGYKVDVTHGINEFFDRIRDKYFYEPFEDRTPFSLDVNSAALQNQNDPFIYEQTGLFFPIADYFQSTPLAEYQLNYYAVLEKAFEFICEDVGYNFVDNTNGKISGKCFGGGKLFEYAEEKNQISKTLNLKGNGSTIIDTYYTKKKGVIEYQLSMSYELLSSIGMTFGIFVYVDGVSTQIYGTSPITNNVVIDATGIFSTGGNVYPTGTKVEIEIVTSTDPNADLIISFGDYNQPNDSYIRVKESSIYYPSNNFGDLTQIEFISYIFELFNLGFEIDELTKTVTCYSINEVYNPNTGTINDLSSYFSSVITKKFSNNFGNINYFKYNYLDGREKIYDSSFQANNTNKEKTLIDSNITASFHDQSIDLNTLSPFILKSDGYEDSTTSARSNDIGWRVLGFNILYNQSIPPNTLTSDCVPMFGNINLDILNYNGTISTSVPYTLVAITNNDNLDWSSLIENNYSSLRDYVLNRYQEVKLLMRVPRHLIDSFSFQNKIFIEQLNSKFVVQSIKTRPDGLSEWILIKLN